MKNLIKEYRENYKAIKKRIYELEHRLMNLRIQNNADAIQTKVDKESGRQLSEENFTSAEKTKLAGLSNYDDTEIRTEISTVETQINMIYGVGIEIQEYDDINSYTIPGVYYSSGGNISSTLQNSPFTSGGFRLEVRRTTNTENRLIQIAFFNNEVPMIRIRISGPSNKFGLWYDIPLNVVQE